METQSEFLFIRLTQIAEYHIQNVNTVFRIPNFQFNTINELAEPKG